jgi:hypothetical protein
VQCGPPVGGGLVDLSPGVKQHANAVDMAVSARDTQRTLVGASAVLCDVGTVPDKHRSVLGVTTFARIAESRS